MRNSLSYELIELEKVRGPYLMVSVSLFSLVKMKCKIFISSRQSSEPPILLGTLFLSYFVGQFHLQIID